MSIPPPRSLGAGIHLVPAPLPFRSPAWVNTYVVEAGDGLLLVDCGADWEPGRLALAAGFEELGLSQDAVHTLVVSHLHPDHVGMSGRLVREWGCRFVMHQRAARLVHRYNDTPGYVRRMRSLASLHGVPDSVLEAAVNTERSSYMPIIDPPDHTVEDGDEIDLGDGRALVVIHTPGHEASHICLRDTRTGIFFSGDHVLPRISPVIMFDEEVGDPLGDYMTSLNRLLNMGMGLTYPAHGSIIDHGDERARQILLHHERRLNDMATLVMSSETTAWNVMTRSFRPNLSPGDARLAFLETLSHLEHLRLEGRIRSEDHSGTVVYL